MNKKNILFLIIIVIASVLRFWQLGRVPISPDWDEVSLGYNAYSIMQTGKDEYGNFLPIILRSFNDYKPALYVYLAIPSIFLFGLNVVSVRLPSAILGVLTVISVYFVIKELFKKDNLALLSSFLLAISPWHIQFSRVAFESNVGLALNIFGILFFLKSFKKSWFLFFSSIMFGLSLHTYQSEKVFVPLLICSLLISFRKKFLSICKKYIFLSVLLLGIISLPLIFSVAGSDSILSRARGVSIFSNLSIINQSAEKIAKDKENNDILGQFLDNRRISFARYILGGYLSHFDLNWLFISGDNARHHAPRMGLMYLIELPFLLIGIYGLIFGNFPRAAKMLIISWLLIVPVPASVTNDVPHAVRTLNFLPVLQVLTAIGIIFFVKKISNFKFKRLFLFLFGILVVFNFLYYLNQYFVQQNYYHAKYWQFGYENIVKYVANVENNYNKVVVSNIKEMDQSYMFFLFYLKYDPKKYLSEGGSEIGKNHFSNFIFKKISYDDENEKNILLVGSNPDFPKEKQSVFEVDYPDGSMAMRILEKNK